MSADLLDGVTWECAGVRAGTFSLPDDAAHALLDWIPAEVPGTVASALRAAGRAEEARTRDLDTEDWWYRGTFRTPTEPGRPLVLHVGGLATAAAIWVVSRKMFAGHHLLHSENMFRAHDVVLDPEVLAPPGEENILVILFAALAPLLKARRSRPRWRTGLVATQNLRWYRTTLLGRIPGWSPGPVTVGPWQGITLREREPVQIVRRDLHVELDGSDGRIRLGLDLDAAAQEPAELLLDGVVVARSPAGTTRIGFDTTVPAVRQWFPHTHGEQPLYGLTVRSGEHLLDLGRIGFRTVTADRESGGFSLSVNGIPVFCRGALWMPPNPWLLDADEDVLRAALLQARDAGLNMIRVPGTGTWESDTFHDLCDELGLLVWQDCMLATLDPPDDPEFVDDILAEVDQQGRRLQGRPSVAVLSGGSETEQQPALMGLPVESSRIMLQQKLFPDLLGALLPGIPYVTSSPTGGDVPTEVGTGVAHYFGVGAYLRPLSDLRTSGVRFAAECLAFAIPPEPAAIEREFGSAAAAGHSPAWKAGVPRDSGAPWDFDDVRDHYVRDLLGVDPAVLRYTDPERALDLGRAAVAEIVTAAFTEWRQPGSACAGGLVLSLRDLMPGAGWGLVDSTGGAKGPLFALKPVLSPVAVLVTDHGLDGIRLHVVNDTATPLDGELTLRTHTPAATPGERATAPVLVPAHGSVTVSATKLLGGFRDLNHAYRFGPPGYDVVTAEFRTATDVLATTTHFLLGAQRTLEPDVGLTATLAEDDGAWVATISTVRAAQWVALDIPGFTPSASWFHLSPNASRSITLTREDPRSTKRPVGTVRALNSMAPARLS